MHFTLKQLRYVDAALRTGSIVQAAREMNISQSSIAAAIDASEALGTKPRFALKNQRAMTASPHWVPVRGA